MVKEGTQNAVHIAPGAQGEHRQSGINFIALRNTALHWREVAHLGELRRYRKNDVLLDAGSLVDHLLFIHSGEVRRTFMHMDGREKTLFYIGEHAFVGEIMFFLGIPSRSRFVCSKATSVWAFSRKCLMQTILPTCPALVNDLLFSLASKANLMNEHLLIMTMDDTGQRFCKLLSLYMKRTAEGSLQACLPMGKQEQACLLGVHRISLYKVLKELEEQKILVEVSKNIFHIINEEAFAVIVSGAGAAP